MSHGDFGGYRKKSYIFGLCVLMSLAMEFETKFCNITSFYMVALLGFSYTSSYTILTDLHSIGGLVPLLGYLKNSHANIRAKAADVVTTIVQNNPRSQQLVMEANGLDPLISNFTSDPDVTVRTKALGAISCTYSF